jgi:hypothetical protein
MYNVYKKFQFFARPMRVEKPYATQPDPGLSAMPFGHGALRTQVIGIQFDIYEPYQ